ncbi:MAG: hypothetical protein LBK58_08660 [Prevotellaceae bacterium]|jgi:hypothetical protein|nr:hypothetical protein [Prevotellaceae bacterium]
MNTENLKTREIGTYALRAPLTEIVQNLFVAAGQTPPDEDFRFIRDELCKIIPKRYGSLTLPEVETALNAGVLGDYGSYYGINVVSANSWLKSYSEAQNKANRGKPAAAPPEYTAGKTREEIHRDWTEAYERAVCMAKAGKRVIDLGNFVYKHLGEWGEANLAVEDWRQFTEKARQQLEDRAKDAQWDSKVYTPFSYIVERKIYPETVEMRAMRIALNVYLRKLVEP